MSLPRRQQQLHDLLFGRGDVLVDDLFKAMCDTPVNCRPREWIGPYVTALNRSVAERGLRVEPGALKGSYRLVVMTT